MATKGHKARPGNPLPAKPQQEQKHPGEWQQDFNPERMAGQNIGRSPVGDDARGRTAADVKILAERLTDFTRDELAALPIVPVGARLKQGGVYLDLRHPAPVPFTADGQMIAGEMNYYTPKAEVPYEYWNRLVDLLTPGQAQSATERRVAGHQPFSPERARQEAALDKSSARALPAGAAPDDAKIDATIADSFPASDPPSSTGGRERNSRTS